MSMRLLELTIPKILYHGSPSPLKIGKAYRVRHWSTTNQGGTTKDVEAILEKYRPTKSIARNKAFYMIDTFAINTLELTGASTKYVYAVEPIGRVERHDLQWLNDIDSIMIKGTDFFGHEDIPISYSWHMTPIHDFEVPETIEMLAKNYWSGEKYPYKDWSHWEYLSPSFRILKLIHKETEHETIRISNS